MYTSAIVYALKRMIVMISICFTHGVVGIKRGRKVRQYAPTWSSSCRLSVLVTDADMYYPHRMTLCDPAVITQSSTTFQWRGIRSLTGAQLAIVRAYDLAVSDKSVDYNNQSDYMWGYIMAWQDIFRVMDIHPYHLHT